MGMNPSVTVLILGGGQGKRLYPLTLYRSKPAVPLGGKYRLVDIPISNSINSQLRKIFVLTQFNSTSLHRHIHRTYPYEHFNQTSVELLAAEQTLGNRDWFQGTADAVRKHLPHYHLRPKDWVLVLSGDHIYRMDYRTILNYHESKGADLTIATVPVEKKEIEHFGMMRLKADGQVVDFKEKPGRSENVQNFVVPDALRETFELEEKKELYLASMGVYVFRAEILMDLLKGQEADFGREVIPKAIHEVKTYAYIFNGYWRDIGNIRTYYDANLQLTEDNPDFSFFTAAGRIFTRPRFLPSSKVLDSRLDHVLLSEGCMVKGAQIDRSVIGLRSVIKEGSTLRHSILMGADYYQIEEEEPGLPPLGIGKNCVIENAIIDKNARIGNHVKIQNKNKIEEMDGTNYSIRDGIVIISRGTHLPDHTVI